MVVKESAARRGRPRQTAEEAELARAHIVAATTDVFAEHGSHGLNVALIIERAGIARPTFYRYFANAEEPLHVALAESDKALASGILHAIDQSKNEVELAVSVIDAYLSWARDRGPMFRPLFSELYDPASPVFAHRQIAIDETRTLVSKKMIELGRGAPDPIDLDTLLNACAYVVYRVSLDEETDQTLDARARSIMIRIALATVGQPEDLRRVLEIPGVFK